MIVSLGGLLAAAPLGAQVQQGVQPPRVHSGGAFVIAAPVGEFDDYVGTGWGLSGHLVVNLEREGLLGVRIGGGFVNYGRETRRVCFSQTVGCRVEVDLTTTNNIFFAAIGPELAVPTGPIRPYINASIGFAYFATTSSVEDITGTDEIASTTNFDDFTGAWHTGGGIRIPLGTSTPIRVDLGISYHGNGQVEYLTEGGIIDNPDGSITLDPILSDANLLTFNIGVSIGIRRRNRDD